MKQELCSGTCEDAQVAIACSNTSRAGQTLATTTMTPCRRLANILGLSLGWCLMVSVMFIQLSTSTQAARDFSGSATATLPAGVMMAAATATATPGTMIMKRHGRRPVLLLTALAAACGGALLTAAARLRALWLLCLGSIPLGVCFAQSNNLRFAATEFAAAGGEARSISMVVTGAVLSAVVGPEVARHTLHAMDPVYGATYVFVTGLCLLYAVLVSVIEFHRTPELVAEKEAAAAAMAVAAAVLKQVEAEEAAGGKAAAGAGVAPGRGTTVSAVSLGTASLSSGGSGGPDATRSGLGGQPEGPGDAKATVGPAKAGDGGEHNTSCGGGDGEGERTSSRAAPPHPPSPSPSPPPPDAAPQPASGRCLRPAAPPASSGSGGSISPARHVFMSADYAVPVLTASLAYCGMAGMMTASPLALKDANYSFDNVTQVIQVHILAMFVPSLFTGDVVRLLGPVRTMAAGAVLLLGGTAVFFAGGARGTLPVFFAGNAVVGLGWNWAYVGASALVAARLAPHPALRFVGQGAMDSVVLAGTGISVVLAGSLYSWLGWVVYICVFMGVNGLSVVLDAGWLAARGWAAMRARRLAVTKEQASGPGAA